MEHGKRIFVFLLLYHISLSILLSQSSADDFLHLTNIDQELSTPARIAIDAQDNVYVADITRKCILKFDASGNLVTILAQGSFPVSVAISPNGKLFYGDRETGHIYNLGTDGQSELFYSDTEFPTSLAFSPDNILYVADNKLLKVLALDVSGNLVNTIGEGTLVFPTGLAFDARNDRILVAEHGGLGGDIVSMGWFGRGPMIVVHMYDRQGNEIHSFGRPGSSNGRFYRLQGMTIGRCGNIYLCEPFQSNISVFTEDGVFITKFAEFGSGPGQLDMPVDIAFDSQERIIISCYNKGSLELFTIDDPLPSARILTPYVTTCMGSFADISIELSGTPPWSITYTFEGDDPVTINDINSSPYIVSLTQPGEFRVMEVTDATSSGTCVSGIAQVSFHPEPTATFRNGVQSICEGSIAYVPVYFSGDGPWTFTYTLDGNDLKEVSTANNPHLLEVTEAGVYSLKSVIGKNCEGIIHNGDATITSIHSPTSAFTAGNDVIGSCENDPTSSLELVFTGTAPWTFTYTIDDENPITIETSENPYYLAAENSGTYEVTHISDASCSGYPEFTYPEVFIVPQPTVVITLPELGLCPNTTNYIPMEFTGTAPWTFLIQRFGTPAETITTSENPYMHPVNFIGEYTVHSLSDLHCAGNPVGVSIWVRHANPPAASFPDEEIILCEGMTADIPVDFSGTGPWTFTYTHNGMNPATVTCSENPYLLTVSEAGTYNMIALADANCGARKLPAAVQVVEYSMPEASFTYLANELEVSFSNTSVNASEYLWTFGDGNNSTESDPVHLYAEEGEYTVILNAINEECGSVSFSEIISVFALKDMEAGTTPVKDEFTELSLNVYPNPSEGMFTIELQGTLSGKVNLEIINMTGQVLYASKLNYPDDPDHTGMLTKSLDLSSYPSGVYQLKIRCGEDILTKLLAVTRN